MSSALIRQVTLGLARHLHTEPLSAQPLVVIGYDGRRLSDVFAQESAAVLVARGFQVALATTLCPTPILAFAVKHLKAVAGIMVTASHNPPRDNGFKVYWGNGAQIIPPQDREISDAIDAVELTEIKTAHEVQRDGGVLTHLDVGFSGELGRAYWHAQLEHLLPRPKPLDHPRPLRIVYTAMHGVGAEWFIAMMRQRDDLELIPVVEQRDPDPEFPTVSFPNPEEPGALDLALALADRERADLILAHDPDADRLAVVARDVSGQMRPFTGDQTGALIAQELLTQLDVTDRDMVATTIVSSSLLAEMARAHKIQYAETLTGFKWIANRALAHEQSGGRFLFGYEEAIGYSLFGLVRDKDGLSAGRLVAEIAWRAHCAGETLWDVLHGVYQEYGLYVSSLESRVRQGSAGAAEIRGWMRRLRSNPPSELGGISVTEVTDFSDQPAPLTGNVLRYRLADGSRVIVRPSGTEPKIKMYFEARISTEGSIDEQQRAGEARLDKLTTSLNVLLDA
jgi:phosphomannomutase